MDQDRSWVLDWREWEELIDRNGFRIDRPRGSAHPSFPEMVYPLDYGFVPGTRGGDGQELDIFVGTARERSVVGLVETVDLVKNDTEIKLLFQMTPSEIAIVHDFLNASGMRTHLVQRWPPAQ